MKKKKTVCLQTQVTQCHPLFLRLPFICVYQFTLPLFIFLLLFCAFKKETHRFFSLCVFFHSPYARLELWQGAVVKKKRGSWGREVKDV